MKDIVLCGAGGLARETVQLIHDINAIKPEYNFLGFVVEEGAYKKDSFVAGYPVLGPEEWVIENQDKVFCCCAVGTPEPRAKIQRKLENFGVRFESLISPHAVICERSTIGKGCIITRGVIISVDCIIGDGVLLNHTNIIGHDCSVGNFSCVMVNVSVAGEVTIGEQVYIGSHAFILQQKKIGDRSTIAAGSIVLTDVKPDVTAFGNPARCMPSMKAHKN